MEENVYEMSEKRREELGIESLPETLGQALEELKRDRVVRDALGKAYRNFIRYKEREWAEYLSYLESKGIPPETKEVTEWELERYFYV